jgi:hypothetical protein
MPTLFLKIQENKKEEICIVSGYALLSHSLNNSFLQESPPKTKMLNAQTQF